MPSVNSPQINGHIWFNLYGRHSRHYDYDCCLYRNIASMLTYYVLGKGQLPLYELTYYYFNHPTWVIFKDKEFPEEIINELKIYQLTLEMKGGL
jgi:hypothetical protein